jgi:hypothetical protein
MDIIPIDRYQAAMLPATTPSWVPYPLIYGAANMVFYMIQKEVAVSQ